MPTNEAPVDAAPDAPQAPAGGISRKVWIRIAIVVAAVWAFTIYTGSTVLLIIVTGLVLRRSARVSGTESAGLGGALGLG